MIQKRKQTMIRLFLNILLLFLMCFQVAEAGPVTGTVVMLGGTIIGLGVTMTGNPLGIGIMYGSIGTGVAVMMTPVGP